MSNAASSNATQTPQMEAVDRALEQLPVLGLPRLVAVEHLREMLFASRGRVRDDHKRQKAILDSVAKEGGLLQPTAEADADDDMGGISIAGDTNVTITAPAQPTAAQQATSGESVFKKMLPLILAAAMGGGIASLPALYEWIKKPSAVVQPTEAGYQLGLEVKDAP